MLHAVLAMGAAAHSVTLSSRMPVSAARVRSLAPHMGLLEEVADGNIASTLEVASIAVAAAVGTSAAWSLVQREEADATSADDKPPVRRSESLVPINVDLGPDGEPKGINRLFFKPRLPRSEILVVNLTIPLGLLIEERETDGAIVVTGALPGFGAIGAVEEGDLVRAVTAYASVAGDAPMWQQVTSGTPIGDVARRRLIFKTEGATFANVRDAIASHRRDDDDDGFRGSAAGRPDQVTLVLERASNASSTPQGGERAQLESLQDVLKRDLATPPGQEAGQGARGKPPPSPAERARRIFD